MELLPPWLIHIRRLIVVGLKASSSIRSPNPWTVVIRGRRYKKHIPIPNNYNVRPGICKTSEAFKTVRWECEMLLAGPHSNWISPTLKFVGPFKTSLLNPLGSSIVKAVVQCRRKVVPEGMYVGRIHLKPSWSIHPFIHQPRKKVPNGGGRCSFG